MRNFEEIDSVEFRFLFIGGLNTLFGYSFSLIFYYTLQSIFPTLLILIINSCVAISFSFVTLKLYVFRTKGNWLAEYLRSYLVYGSTTLISILFTLILVDYFQLHFWIVQLFLLFIVVCFSYIGHKKFTFRKFLK